MLALGLKVLKHGDEMEKNNIMLSYNPSLLFWHHRQDLTSKFLARPGHEGRRGAKIGANFRLPFKKGIKPLRRIFRRLDFDYRAFFEGSVLNKKGVTWKRGT